MKLLASFSEAIRVGAKIRPQCFGMLRTGGNSCALQAGLEVVGAAYQDAVLAYPYLENASPPCPVGKCGEMDQVFQVLGDCITHLNDDHRWSRERIADWLEEHEEELGFVTLIEREPVTKFYPINEVSETAARFV